MKKYSVVGLMAFLLCIAVPTIAFAGEGHRKPVSVIIFSGTTMSEHSEHFLNVSRGGRPDWRIAGSKPFSCDDYTKQEGEKTAVTYLAPDAFLSSGCLKE